VSRSYYVGKARHEFKIQGFRKAMSSYYYYEGRLWNCVVEAQYRGLSGKAFNEGCDSDINGGKLVCGGSGKKLSPSRKFSQPFFSMKMLSDRAIKTALGSVRCPLRHIKTSAESVDSFLERWARQLAHYRASGTAQKSLVEYQLYMESQRSNCVESIDRPLCNSLPFPGSLRQVLASPDRELAPKSPHLENFRNPFSP